MTMHRPHSPQSKQADTPLTGIYKLAEKDLPALKQAASELKHAFFSVDLHAASNVPGFIKALQRDLAFPAYFGGNLDALNDCLCDFSWRPAREAGDARAPERISLVR